MMLHSTSIWLFGFPFPNSISPFKTTTLSLICPRVRGHIRHDPVDTHGSPPEGHSTVDGVWFRIPVCIKNWFEKKQTHFRRIRAHYSGRKYLWPTTSVGAPSVPHSVLGCVCVSNDFFLFSFTVDRRPSERSSGRDKFRIYQQYNERRRFLSGSPRAVCGGTVFFFCFCTQARSSFAGKRNWPKKNRFWCNMRNACKSQPASQRRMHRKLRTQCWIVFIVFTILNASYLSFTGF